MRNIYFILIFSALTACTSFDTRVLDDPKYLSGKEYGTNKKIQPKVLQFGDYIFVCGYSNKGPSLGAYYKNKELHYETGGDGYWYDTIYKANFNNDNISDFIISYQMEDYWILTALVSKTKDEFQIKELGDPFDDTYCLVGYDTLKNIQFITTADINNDNKDEVLINMVTINNRRFGIACSDTLYVDNIK